MRVTCVNLLRFILLPIVLFGRTDALIQEAESRLINDSSGNFASYTSVILDSKVLDLADKFNGRHLHETVPVSVNESLRDAAPSLGTSAWNEGWRKR
jgi:hypothetical protein